MTDDALRAAAEQAGLMTVWRDTAGQDRFVAPDVLRRLLDVVGPGPVARPPLLTADLGAAALLPLPSGPARLTLEDGSVRELHLDPGEAGAWLPAVDQPGYHHLATGDAEVTLAVAPPRCWTVADACPGRRAWGLAVQIYGLREAGTGGIGGFGALRGFVRDAAARGADAVAISPVHAQFAADPDRFSPYAPSSRVHLNVLHADATVAMERAPGTPADDPAIAEELARLDALDLLDWPAAARARMHSLRRLFAAFSAEAPEAARAAFAAFRARGGEALDRHARFEALHAALLGQDRAHWQWRTWPEGLRGPDGPAIAPFAADHAEEIAFHAFVQYLADRSLVAAQAAARAAGMGVGLIADVAVGVDAGGSDAWASPAELLHGVSIGAPPDAFSALGQSWGVTSFAPSGLPASGYRSFLAMLRQVVEAVAAMIGKQPARQLDGAQHLRPDVEPGAAQGGPQVAVVEARVVGDEEAAIEAVEDRVGDLGKGWRMGHHVVVDAGEALDVVGDARLGAHQRRPLAHAVLVDLDDADLGDGFALGRAAGGLDVHEGEAAWRQAEGSVQGGRLAGAVGPASTVRAGSGFRRALQRALKPASSIAW